MTEQTSRTVPESVDGLRRFFEVVPCKVEGEPSACRIDLHVGVQTIRIGPEYCEDAAHAEWFIYMICKALQNIIASIAPAQPPESDPEHARHLVRQLLTHVEREWPHNQYLVKLSEEFLKPRPDTHSPEQIERGFDSIVDVLAERDRLQKLSNQQLVDECLKTDAADYEIVSIMLDRLDPGWERRTKTAGDKPPRPAYPFKPTDCPHIEHTFQRNGCGLDIRNARLMQPRNALDDEYLNGLAISFTEPIERIGCNYHFTKCGIIGLLHNLAATVEGMVRDGSSHGAPSQNTKDVD